MRRTDLVAAIFIAVAAVSSAMGWDKAATNDEQRITAIQTMAQALAECNRKSHIH
jgi:hypothetical protein